MPQYYCPKCCTALGLVLPSPRRSVLFKEKWHLHCCMGALRILIGESMSHYYCLTCRTRLGLVSPVRPFSLTGTPDQAASFTKHTAPTGIYQVNSIFDKPTYEDYAGYVATGTLAGDLVINYYGQKSLIWYSDERTGAEYHNGVFVAPTFGVKIVWVENEGKIHAYPFQESPNPVDYCSLCKMPRPIR